MSMDFNSLLPKFMLLPIFFIINGCQETSQEASSDRGTASLRAGIWHSTLEAESVSIPFTLSIEKNGAYQGYLLNAEERIWLDSISVFGDSIAIPMHVFNTELRAKILSKDKLAGEWIKYDYPNYRMKFNAVQDSSLNRFEYPTSETEKEPTSIAGKWSVGFVGEKGENEPAIGVFSQTGQKVTGTFLTPLGDYRYLEGVVAENQLKLSCFDGEHAFLFTATIQDENTISDGMFWSGNHWSQPWAATRDENAQIPNPEALTYLKDGFDKLQFSFPNKSGELVSLDSEQYQDKVVIVQLMGSWCPNCMDETRFLANYYKENAGKGVEIIGLAYERLTDPDKAWTRLDRLKNRFNIGYEILLAGTDDKTEASSTLPMLNAVLAFPTTIFIDKNGNVRKVHTGFSGPGTGKYYAKTVEDFKRTVDKLLAE